MGLTSGLITKGIKGLPGSIHLSLLPDTEVSEQHSTTMPPSMTNYNLKL